MDEELKFLDITQNEPSLSEQIETAKIEDLPELVGRVALGAGCASEREALLQAISKKFKVPLRALREDVGVILPNTRNETREKDAVLSAILPGLVDLVLDEKGRAVYLFHGGNGAGLNMADEYTDDRGRFIPPPAEHLPFPLVPGAEVLRTYDAGGNPAGLFNDVLHYLRRFSFLPERDFLLLGAYAFLTYLQDHAEISYIPMIFFFAVPERGKSRTGKALTWISFRGSHRVDLRETNLFRDAENLAATLFLDIMDLWKKAERNESTDILLLRYERGARVARVLFPEKGPFNDTRYFNVFGPTIMASNEPVHRILGTRCIPFTMPNRPGRFEDTSPEKGLPLRIRLTAWRASMMDVTLSDVEPVPEITGRLWDISKPLLMVAAAVCPHRYNEIVEALVEKARERTEEKRDSIEGKIVQTLAELSVDPPVTEWEIQAGDILSRINADVPEHWRWTSQKLGRRLKALSLRTRKSHGTMRIVLTRETLSTLAAQYGVVFIPERVPGNSSPNSPKEESEITTETYTGESRGRVGESEKKLPRNSPAKDTVITKEIPSGESGEFLRGVQGQEKKHDKQIPLFEVSA